MKNNISIETEFNIKLIKDLSKFFTKYLYLLPKDIQMFELQGYGEIQITFNDIYMETYEFMKGLDYLSIIPEDHGLHLPNKIMFYANEVKQHLEENRKFDHIYYDWNNSFHTLLDEYVVNNLGGSSKCIWTHDVTSPYIIHTTFFFTRGSEIGGDKRVETRLFKRKLESWEKQKAWGN